MLVTMSQVLCHSNEVLPQFVLALRLLAHAPWKDDAPKQEDKHIRQICLDRIATGWSLAHNKRRVFQIIHVAAALATCQDFDPWSTKSPLPYITYLIEAMDPTLRHTIASTICLRCNKCGADQTVDSCFSMFPGKVDNTTTLEQIFQQAVPICNFQAKHCSHEERTTHIVSSSEALLVLVPEDCQPPVAQQHKQWTQEPGFLSRGYSWFLSSLLVRKQSAKLGDRSDHSLPNQHYLLEYDSTPDSQPPIAYDPVAGRSIVEVNDLNVSDKVSCLIFAREEGRCLPHNRRFCKQHIKAARQAKANTASGSGAATSGVRRLRVSKRAGTLQEAAIASLTTVFNKQRRITIVRQPPSHNPQDNTEEDEVNEPIELFSSDKEDNQVRQHPEPPAEHEDFPEEADRTDHVDTTEDTKSTQDYSYLACPHLQKACFRPHN
eukprot:Skav206234  [mRNA]  locus=scaffold197:21327:22628:- [translate_table: standard]